MSSKVSPSAAFPVLCALLAAVGPACVPTGSAPAYDAGVQPTLTSTFKPSLNIMTAPFEDSFDRPDGGDWAGPGLLGDAATTADAAIDAALGVGADARGGGETGAEAASPFGIDAGSDAGAQKPTNLGPNWLPMKTNAWRVENGKLCGEGAHTHGLWLNRTLPINARIEFDAVAMTDDGDLKVELWGDGKSYATSTSYTNATSYIAVLGGWKNTKHVLARLNEHGNDAREVKVDKTADDERQRPVLPLRDQRAD